MMKFILVVALFQSALCGNVNIRMPYLAPAGVTYVDGTVHAGLSAGPVAYTTATARPYAAYAPAPAAVAYGAHAVAPVAYGAQAVAPVAPFSRVAYGSHAVAPVAYGAHAVAPVAPVAYSAPVAYQPVTKYAAVPTVQHVHGVADVPVTRYEAQPAVIQKAIDVAKPAIKTRKYEIRRPAIQKQFYDIEERVIVRPAGSALVELDEPISKTQKGAAVVSPAAYAAVHAVHAVPTVAAVRTAAYAVPTVHAVPALRTAAIVPAVATKAIVPAIPAYARLHPFAGRVGYNPYGFSGFPTHFQFTQAQLTGAPSTESPAQSTQSPPAQGEDAQTPYPFERPESTPAPQQMQPNLPEQVPPMPQPQFDDVDDSDSVSVENPELSGRSAPSAEPAQSSPEPETAAAEPAPTSATAPENAEAPQARARPEERSAGFAPLQYSNYDLIPQARSGPSLVPSLRNLSPEMSQANQQRLIDLFTARGGVTEVGVGRSGPAVNPVGEAGQVRARVISATPAPYNADPTGERVNTRRVVVSNPIETLQEIEVQEPVTKLERIHVNHPTFIKTARQDIVRVPTSVPVLGKAYAPVAHGAVPVAHAAIPSYSHYYG